MKTTYHETLMIRSEELTAMTFTIGIFDQVKYEATENGRTVQYTGVKAWTIISGGNEAKAIEAIADKNGIDEYHEYLILHFENGTTAIFRNSHVDLWIHR